MAEIVTLAEHRPHMTGEARCIECRHEWETSAPVGTVRLECPSCGLDKGAWTGGCETGADLWTCDCGNDLYVIHGDRIMCARCGLAQHGMFD